MYFSLLDSWRRAYLIVTSLTNYKAMDLIQNNSNIVYGCVKHLTKSVEYDFSIISLLKHVYCPIRDMKTMFQ